MVPIRGYRYEHEADIGRVTLEAVGILCAIMGDTYFEVMGVARGWPSGGGTSTRRGRRSTSRVA